MKILPKICSGEMVVSASIPEPGVGAAMTELKTLAAWPWGIGNGHIDLRKVDIAGGRVGRRFSQR
ncbi:MAG: hypothetical protein EPO19_11250 [Betaproteobacteria bacterium]|nr:MAG: hypothetical protein EPO19_11250 [Betaproteobacteria bacterium]